MQPLYLVAILPAEPVFSEVWAMKQEVHTLTGSRNAVRLPAHITLHSPVAAGRGTGATHANGAAGVCRYPGSV